MLHTYFSAQPYQGEVSKLSEVSPKNINGPTYTPVELATLYGFPNDVDGTGQTIGIIELGGGYTLSDFHAYLTAIGVTKVPNVVDVSVNGGVNNPSQVDPSFEVCLDLDIIGAVAPGANIRMYFAPNALTSSFVAAVQAAVNDNCNIISISWGSAELNWSAFYRNSMNTIFQQAAAQGISIFCAAGDKGASDGQLGLNVDFPGSSPYGVSCGGTTVTSANGVITSETVWGTAANESTGGGISAVFSKPSYQNTVPLLTTYSFRGTPDIAANANPYTGYITRVGASYYIIGGTSAVSPLLSALTALVNQKRLAAGKPVLGFMNKVLYSAPLAVFRDITQGGNFGYDAASGWDFTTGLGSPSSDLTTFLVNYVAPPVSSFTASTLSGAVPLSVTLTDTSTGAPTGWYWDFGNGTNSSQQNPTVTYNTPGTYTVTLTVTNANGSSSSTKTITASEPLPPPPVSSFNSNKLSGTAPLIVTFTDTSTGTPTAWAWNFGNGATSTLQNPAAVTYATPGTYTVTLTVSNAGGSSSSTKTITVTVPPPVCSFSSNKMSGTVPLSVTFTDTSAGAPTAWAWNFGNGATSTAKFPPTIVYNTPGTFTITLTVTNAGGSSSSSKTVTATSAPVAPLSVFSVSPVSGSAPLTVAFTNSSTGSPTSWLWTFGNGATSTLQNPAAVTYTVAKTYTVSLKVTNSIGTHTSSKTVTVTASSPPAPVANFTATNRTVTFTDTSSNSPTSWLWTFGDGSTSTARNPVKTYVNAGTYTVTLKATNAKGFTTLSKTITVT